MSFPATARTEVLISALLSGILAAAAAVWHSPWWWIAVVVCGLLAIEALKVGKSRGGEAEAYYVAAVMLGRAELKTVASELSAFAKAALGAAGDLSIDRPGVWELTQVRCASCGGEYPQTLKYDLYLRPATAERYACCSGCGSREVVLTYDRSFRTSDTEAGR